MGDGCSARQHKDFHPSPELGGEPQPGDRVVTESNANSSLAARLRPVLGAVATGSIRDFPIASHRSIPLRLHDHLSAFVLIIPERLVAIRRVAERQAMADHERRIDLSVLN